MSAQVHGAGGIGGLHLRSRRRAAVAGLQLGGDARGVDEQGVSAAGRERQRRSADERGLCRGVYARPVGAEGPWRDVRVLRNVVYDQTFIWWYVCMMSCDA